MTHEKYRSTGQHGSPDANHRLRKHDVDDREMGLSVELRWYVQCLWSSRGSATLCVPGTLGEVAGRPKFDQFFLAESVGAAGEVSRANQHS